MRAMQKSRKKYEADFLVDTGATDSMAPASGFEKPALSPPGK